MADCTQRICGAYHLDLCYIPSGKSKARKDRALEQAHNSIHNNTITHFCITSKQHLYDVIKEMVRQIT
ncbi:hypothetical protein AAZX31_05G183200 [Glycine max]